MTIYKHMNVLREKIINSFITESKNAKYWSLLVPQFKKRKLTGHHEIRIIISKDIYEHTAKTINKYKMIMIFLHYLEPINYGKKIRKIRKMF